MKSPRTWRGARWRPVFQGRYEISLSDVIRDVSRIKCCSVVLLVGGKKKKKKGKPELTLPSPRRLNEGPQRLTRRKCLSIRTEYSFEVVLPKRPIREVRRIVLLLLLQVAVAVYKSN